MLKVIHQTAVLLGVGQRLNYFGINEQWHVASRDLEIIRQLTNPRCSVAAVGNILTVAGEDRAVKFRKHNRE